MNALLAAGLAALGWWLWVGEPPLRRLRVSRAVAWRARFARRGPDRGLAGQLPDALDLLAVALEAGTPMLAAVRAVAQVSPQPTAGLLDEVASRVGLGYGEVETWRGLAGHPVWGRPARDIARSARSGTMLVETLRMLAAEARLVEQDRAIKVARTVGVRSVLPLMACFLPAFVLVGVVPIIAGLLSDLVG